jgi:hypothetical protein
VGCIGWWGERGSLGQAVRPISRRAVWSSGCRLDDYPEMELDVDAGAWTLFDLSPHPLYTLYHDAMLYFTIHLITWRSLSHLRQCGASKHNLDYRS